MPLIPLSLYEKIKEDLAQIEDAMASKVGSGRSWRTLRARYSVLLPEVRTHITETEKMYQMGSEGDYRLELSQLREMLFAYLEAHSIKD